MELHCHRGKTAGDPEKAMMTNPIELWLDLSCPWCQGALPVMRQLLAEEAPRAQVMWRPVRLHPLDPQGRDFHEYMTSHGAGAAREIEDYNLARGRDLNLDRITRLHHPGLAHGLLALARQTQGVDIWQLASALWDANWRDGIDISDPTQLERALPGLPEELWAQLTRGDGAALVDADRERAGAIGLDGVPRFYLNDTIVPAWLDPEVVRAKLREALIQ